MSAQQTELLRNEYEESWEGGRYQQALAASRQLLPRQLRSRDPAVRSAALIRAAGAELKTDHHAQARDLYERALAEAEQRQPADPGTIAEALTGLAEARRGAGDLEGLEALIERAVTLCRASGDPHLPDALAELGHLYAAQGREDEAIAQFRRALVESERLGATAQRGRARYVDAIGQIEFNRGDLQQAQERYGTALELAVQRFGEAHAEAGRYRMHLASVYGALGRFQEAESQYRTALAVLIDAYGVESRVVLSLRNNLALLIAQRGDRDAAVPLFVEVLGGAQRLGNAKLVLAALVNLCDNEGILGNFERAEAYCRQVIDMVPPDARNPFERLTLGSALSSLGNRYSERGRYPEAEEYLTRALSVLEDATGSRSTHVAEVRRNLGLMHVAQGNLSAGIDHLEFALARYREIYGDASFWVAQNLTNLGEAELMNGHRVRAVELGQRALEEFSALEKPDFYMSVALGLLVDACRDPCPTGDRLQLATRAQEFARAMSGESSVSTGHAVASVAQVLAERGQHRAASAKFERAVAILEGSLGPLSPAVSTTLRSLAWEEAAAKRFGSALRDFERLEALEEEQLRTFLGGVPEARQRAFLERARTSLDTLVAFQLRYRPRSDAARRLVLRALLRRKARSLDATAAQLQRVRAAGGTGAQSLEALGARRADLATLVLRAPKELTEDHSRRVAELRDQIEELEGRIAREVGLRAAPAATVEDVGAALPRGAALVEFVRFATPDTRVPQRYAVYVLRDQGRVIESADLGDAREIEKRIGALRDSIAVPGGGAASAARALDRRLLEPIEPFLAGVEELYVAPDAALHLVPFAALVDERGHHRLQQFEIAYLDSGRDLLRTSAPELALAAPDPPLVLGGAAFDQRADDDASPQLAASVADAGTAATRGRRSGEMGSRRFARLAASEVEVDQIAGVLNVPAHRGREASEERIKAARSPLVLHVATHAFFLADLPSARLGSGLSSKPLPILRAQESSMLRSGLALAGANLPPGEAGEDGVLTALEASMLQLSGTELVTLSACDTGVGLIDRGEGVLGLRRAFALAGAHSQLLTLWSVNDVATQRFMLAYYGRLLRGEGRAEALRAVQREFLADPVLSDANYWAPFLLAGERGSIPGLQIRSAPARGSVADD